MEVKEIERVNKELSAMKSKWELQSEAQEEIKKLIKAMNGLSEEGFTNKNMNDPYFRKGFQVLVDLFMQAKFKE
jgi:hypothetical protein